MISETPTARAARSIRSKAVATSGRIRWPWRVASGPSYPPPAGARSPGGASSASAAAAMGVCLRPTVNTSRTVTRTRTGANEPASGNATRTLPAPLARATRVARRPAEREVLGLAEVVRARRLAVGEHRLEQPRVRVMHRPCRRERAEVRGPLRPRLPPTPASDKPEHERAENDGHEPAHEDDRRLPALRPHARNLRRPHPASAVVRAPGAVSGPRIVSGTLYSARPDRAKSVSR